MENNFKSSPKPKTIKEFFRSWSFWRPFLGILLGGAAGFLYYHFVGCSTGGCLITSHSYTTVIFGGLSGFLVSGVLEPGTGK